MGSQARYGYLQRAGLDARRWLLPLCVSLLALPIQGCGSDGDEVTPPPARQLPRGYMTQPVLPQGQMYSPGGMPQGQPWSQWPQGQPQQPPGTGQMYPQARNPWQGPPVGFGREQAQGQMMWPPQQPRPEAPQFRPWEEEHAKEQAKQMPYRGAPYDRPLGSSHSGGQPQWPGAYPPGYAPGYGYYPPAGPGYWGMPSPWGMGMPGVWSGW